MEFMRFKDDGVLYYDIVRIGIVGDIDGGIRSEMFKVLN